MQFCDGGCLIIEGDQSIAIGRDGIHQLVGLLTMGETSEVQPIGKIRGRATAINIIPKMILRSVLKLEFTLIYRLPDRTVRSPRMILRPLPMIPSEALI
jgi:hypothetical protein